MLYVVLRVPEGQWLNRGVDASSYLYATLEYCDIFHSNSPDGATECLCGIHRRLDLCDFDFGQFLADRTIGRAYGTVCRLSVVVCRPSVTFCIVAKRCVLAKKCLKE